MTRQPAPYRPPVALTIAGSDSGGGAGIQADLKTMEARGVFGTSVLTAVTAQNTQEVRSQHVLPMEEIEAQLDAVNDDFELGAVKMGMLATREIIEVMTIRARAWPAPVVVDPVMVAASGDRLLDEDAEDEYEYLIDHATLVTPNLDEAEILTGIEVEDEASARKAGEALVEMGTEGALIKGGHLPGDRVRDVLVTADDVHTFVHPRIDGAATHGSGCTLSSAIAADLAKGADLESAVQSGIEFMERAVRYHLDVGEGEGSVHHLADLRNRAGLPEAVDAVEDVVSDLVDADASPLIPEVGMNVACVPPFAERPDEAAAVEGRITRVEDGVRSNRGVRVGASSHVARFLLAAREMDADLRCGANCRHDDAVTDALDELDWTVAEFDREAQPEEIESAEGSTMAWGAERAFESVEETPAAVVDGGAVGKEPMCRVLAPDAGTLSERLLVLLEAVESVDE
ncbi:MAG: hydroxymethylpyrimidine kinase/phosphomethylpyrimidine kinase [Halobacteriales archaeon]|jgi:hydroxymethylpyrimidine kinase/phosphomethylpyrimidine kinase